MGTAEAIQKVTPGRHYGARSNTLEAYRPLGGDELLAELTDLARELNGVRLCHVNSSAAGGGVAELLAREVPLLEALGVSCDWRVIRADEEFFAVTKAFHNALHGSRARLGPNWASTYLEHTRASADALTGDYNVFIVHDPQPAAICQFRRRRGEHWLWRSHVDSSTPDPEVWQFLRPLIQEYDGAVFTMKEFVPADLAMPLLEIVPPAIDPLSSQNMDIPIDLCRRAVADLGIDVSRPLVLQVSRFDRWKDPLGVIEAYRLARRQFPGLQLALAGMLAEDDPEGHRMLDQVEDEAGNDPDIFVLTNLGNMEVNVFQRCADVVLQKSLKEGFGLVVSEALWKTRPVVAGNVGGIPMQIPPGHERFLVDSVQACAERLVELLRDAELRRTFGESGRRHVRDRYLLPRLVRDDLRVIRAIVNGSR
jgi:trehalose synthase